MSTLTPEQLASYLEAIDVLGGVQVPDVETAMQIMEARPGTTFTIRDSFMTSDNPTVQIDVEVEGDEPDV